MDNVKWRRGMSHFSNTATKLVCILNSVGVFALLNLKYSQITNHRCLFKHANSLYNNENMVARCKHWSLEQNASTRSVGQVIHVAVYKGMQVFTLL